MFRGDDVIRIDKKLQEFGFNAESVDVKIQCDMNLSSWMGKSEPQEQIQNYYLTFELFSFKNGGVEMREIIGQATCNYLSGYDSLHNRLTDLRELADASGEELLSAITPVTNELGILSEQFPGNDIMHIDNFYIYPQFRGIGFGTALFPYILDVIGRGASVITTIPRPMKDDGRERIDPDDPRHKLLIKTMTRFIQKFGFFQVDKRTLVWAKDTHLQSRLNRLNVTNVWDDEDI